MKLAGLTLDFYDDPSLLKETFPEADKLPEVIKIAHILNPEEREILRDEAYALILVNEGKSLRKFAMVDAGNTMMSVLYFVKNHDKLPTEAVKVAAAGLIAACEEFNLSVPTLLKVAAKSGMSRTRDPKQQPVIGDEADWNSRTNLVSIRGGGADAGRVGSAVSTMKTANVVDVSAGEPRLRVKKASITNYALGDRYPLDSYADVKKAIEYFENFHSDFTPEARHEYAVKTASRADELGITLTENISRYGSTEYAPDVDAHLANRRAISHPEYHSNYNMLQEKRASLDPEVFADLLRQADEAAGVHHYYGGEVADPYYATFGGKSAKEKVAGWSWESRNGHSVNEEQLVGLSSKGVLDNHFTSDISTAFAKEPREIFESLPDDSKTIIARLAQEA